jgi:hypothetical protein
MTYKTELIGTMFAVSLAITASIALAQTGGQTTHGQQASEPKWAGHMPRMAEYCNGMVKGTWQ